MTAYIGVPNYYLSFSVKKVCVSMLYCLQALRFDKTKEHHGVCSVLKLRKAAILRSGQKRVFRFLLPLVVNQLQQVSFLFLTFGAPV